MELFLDYFEEDKFEFDRNVNNEFDIGLYLRIKVWK